MNQPFVPAYEVEPDVETCGACTVCVSTCAQAGVPGALLALATYVFKPL